MSMSSAEYVRHQRECYNRTYLSHVLLTPPLSQRTYDEVLASIRGRSDLNYTIPSLATGRHVSSLNDAGMRSATATEFTQPCPG